MHPILLQVQSFLNKAQKRETFIDDELKKEFANLCVASLDKHFNSEKRDFRLYVSNVGRPLCQLQLEKAGVEKIPQPYSNIFRNLFGDLIEAAAIIVMKAAGVNVQDQDEVVYYDVGGITIKGRTDLTIDSEVYDIKSASPYAFSNKFGDHGGFKKLADEDTFGYIVQGVLYGECLERPFAGWIVINKSTGEWNILETPDFKDNYIANALETVEKNVKAIITDAPFKKQFEPVDEYFKKKKTGNQVLCYTCSECEFRKHCWPEAKYLPNVNSDAKAPGYKWYTKLS